MMRLRPVTKDNWRALAKLKVREDQRHFVASNVYSIAEAHYGDDEPDGSHWDMFPFGIYDENTPVGFAMYAINLSYPKYEAYIIRLMTDENYQGKGYGRFAMSQLLELIRTDERVRNVGISYEPENDVARKLYASFGFVETGEILDGEVVAVLKLR